jgi:hypothetical protein
MTWGHSTILKNVCSLYMNPVHTSSQHLQGPGLFAVLSYKYHTLTGCATGAPICCVIRENMNLIPARYLQSFHTANAKGLRQGEGEVAVCWWTPQRQEVTTFPELYAE